MSSGIQPQFIAIKEISGTIKKVVSEQGAETFIGSMTTTKGIYILLFSHRLNKEFSLVVGGNDPAPVLAKVFEALAPGSAI